MRNRSIRTKIIGGYLLFVLLIISFLGINRWLMSSTVETVEAVFETTEEIRLEMEAENIFWRQVDAMTEFLLVGEDKYANAFSEYGKQFLQRLDTVEVTCSEIPTKAPNLRPLRAQYAVFLAKFDKAVKLSKSGRKAEAIQVEIEEIDPAEHEVERILETLIKQEKAELEELLTRIQTFKVYVKLFPFLATTIENGERLYQESTALQNSLVAESNFRKQVIDVTDLFLFEKTRYVERFQEHGKLFHQALQREVALSEQDGESELVRAIQSRHRLFSDAFANAAQVYSSGDKAAAQKIDFDEVLPAALGVGELFESYYPIRQRNMKAALANVTLIDGAALSVTKNLGVFVFVLLAVGLALGVVGAFLITKPVGQLAAAIQRIAAGDFTARAPVKSNDEIGKLAGSFNGMAEALLKTTVSKDYVNTIIQSMIDSLIVVSSDGVIRTVNGATSTLLGYEVGELVGQRIDRIIPSIKSSDKRMIELLEDELAGSVEKTYLAKDGSRIPVSLSGSVMPDASGTILGLVFVAQDITERKRVEDELKRQALELGNQARLLDLAHDTIIVRDQNNAIIFWNRGAEKTYGWEKNDALGNDTHEFLQTQFPRSMEDVQAALLTCGYWEGELTHTTRYGTKIVVASRQVLQRDERGLPQSILEINNDITERKNAEAELARLNTHIDRQRQRLNNIVATVPGVVWETLGDPVGDEQRNDFVSDYVETLLGYTVEEWLSEPNFWLSIIHPEDRDRAEREAFEDFSAGVAGRTEFRWIRKDGSAIWVESNYVIVTDNEGRSIGIRGVSTDITERKQSQEALQTAKGELERRVEERTIELKGANERLRMELDERIRIEAELAQARDAALESARVKSEFLANMSHEIRTPMNGIIGMTEFTLDTDLNQDQKDSLQMVKESAESLLTIINDILDFSKIEAGRFELAHDDFNLQKLVDDTLHPLSVRARQKDLTLECRFAPDVPLELSGDASRLRQILMNLLGNAIKFTESGEISVLIEKVTQTSETIELHVQIMDTGIGVPRDKQALIFEAFAQADGSTTRKYGGTGLGLAITSQLVTLMRGRIWVESPIPARIHEDHPGSIFHFTLQLGVSSKHAGATTRATTKPGNRDQTRGAVKAELRILLAEDNHINQRLALSLLRKEGHVVELASNGKEAVELLMRTPFDVVLMDLQMPEMNGIEATALIRRREKTLGVRTPVIALTAHAMKGDSERCLRAGMDGYVSKPIHRSTLFQAIADVLPVNDGVTDEEPVEHRTDMSALISCAGGDLNLAREIVQIFIDDYPKFLTEIRDAVDRNDPLALERAAHKAKGALSYFTSSEGLNSAIRLQEMGLKKDLAGASEALVELEQSIAQLRPTLVEFEREYAA